MHRVKNQWFIYIRPVVPVQSGSGGLDLEALDLDLRVREDAAAEVERRQREGNVISVMRSSGFMGARRFTLGRRGVAVDSS